MRGLIGLFAELFGSKNTPVEPTQPKGALPMKTLHEIIAAAEADLAAFEARISALEAAVTQAAARVAAVAAAMAAAAAAQ
jgi:hypothetical protein